MCKYADEKHYPLNLNPIGEESPEWVQRTRTWNEKRDYNCDEILSFIFK